MIKIDWYECICEAEFTVSNDIFPNYCPICKSDHIVFIETVNAIKPVRE